MMKRLLTLAAGILLAFTASAQQMPQDNWRYDGLQFSSPVPANQLRSIAIGSGGVYVGEVFSGGNPNRVLRFTEAGVFVSRFADTFGYILGLACDPAGNVYVLDRTSSNVKMYDSAGNFIRQWGSAGSGDGQFSIATATGNTMISVNKDSEIYIADPGNTRVQVFNSSGTFLRKWGQAGSLPGQFGTSQPSGVVVGDDNRVYATPGKVFDANGTYITTHYSTSYPSTFYAVNKDGMFFVNAGAAGISIVNLQGSTSSFRSNDATGAVNGPTTPAAFSDRGNLFCVSNTGNKINVWKREYQDSLNFLAPTGIPQPIIISSAQRPGTSLVDIDFRVTDGDDPAVTTGVLAFKPININDTTPRADLRAVVPMNTFVEGTAANVGSNQTTGVIKHLTWNMAADWAVSYSNIQIEALAKDTRNLLGIHWITVPASGGFPAFQASYSPINNGQLLDLWFWFIATQQGVTLTRTVQTGSGGYDDVVLTGNTGVYNGAVLASQTSPSATYVVTSAGRAFAYEKMGVRAIDGGQIARANAGNYGFQDQGNGIRVTQNSVVKDPAVATSYLKVNGTGGYGEGSWLSFPAPNLSKVAAGSNFNLLLRADGTLLGVGYNASGQLGDGTSTIRNGPVFIASGVAQMAAGASHSLFVKTDGTLWAMGSNYYGQLGDGTTTDGSTPVQVANNVASVSASNSHSLFIKTDGSLWAMGENSFRQLGDGTTTQRLSPVQIATGVAQASAGVQFSLFVKTDGTLWSTGRNDYGQLGNAGGSTPQQVTTGVSQVAAGGNFSVILKSNGSLWTVGYNGNGQLGDGTTTNRSTPVQVVASGVTRIAAGDLHTVFTKTDNSLWGMGYGYGGQLGDTVTVTTGAQLTPIQFGVNVSAIAARSQRTLSIIIP